MTMRSYTRIGIDPPGTRTGQRWGLEMVPNRWCRMPAAVSDHGASDAITQIRHDGPGRVY